MKKIFYLLISLLLMVSIYSCSSDDDNDPQGGGKDKITMTIEVQNKDKAPDVGSIVYVFEGFSAAVGTWHYAGAGYFGSTLTGSSWKYTKMGTVGVNGIASIDIVCPTEQQFYTVVVESASDKDSEKRFYPFVALNFEGKDVNYIYVYKGAILAK